MRIRRWDGADGDALRQLVLAYLEETYPAGYDYQPTPDNADRLVDIGLAHAASGDPVLIALDAEGLPLGWTAWFGAVNPFGFCYRDIICFGMGTYVRPAVRKQGIAGMLHREASMIAAAQGYTRVDRLAVGKGGGEPMLQRDGWEARGTWYTKAL